MIFLRFGVATPPRCVAVSIPIMLMPIRPVIARIGLEQKLRRGDLARRFGTADRTRR